MNGVSGGSVTSGGVDTGIVGGGAGGSIWFGGAIGGPPLKVSSGLEAEGDDGLMHGPVKPKNGTTIKQTLNRFTASLLA